MSLFTETAINVAIMLVVVALFACGLGALVTGLLRLLGDAPVIAPSREWREPAPHKLDELAASEELLVPVTVDPPSSPCVVDSVPTPEVVEDDAVEHCHACGCTVFDVAGNCFACGGRGAA